MKVRLLFFFSQIVLLSGCGAQADRSDLRGIIAPPFPTLPPNDVSLVSQVDQTGSRAETYPLRSSAMVVIPESLSITSGVVAQARVYFDSMTCSYRASGDHLRWDGCVDESGYDASYEARRRVPVHRRLILWVEGAEGAEVRADLELSRSTGIR
jgi:hypothetical protein